MKVLSSVIAAWTSALESMERLIGGMPQAVNRGPTLLALSAWHLYPDLLVVGQNMSEIHMRDPLVAAGGALTIGLGQAGDENHRGVYWSLSLAHLRHYGHPVRTERRFSHDSARVTFQQFNQAVFGCLLGTWQLTGPKLTLAAEFFVALDKALNEEAVGVETNDCNTRPSRYLNDSFHWLHLMVQAAYAYLDNNSQEHGTTCKLVNLGLRRSSKFNETPDLWPFFGLSDPKVLLGCLKGPEERIAYLRSVASRSSIGSGPSSIIRYYNTDLYYSTAGTAPLYATAIPLFHKPQKRKHAAEQNQDVGRHHRWLLQQDTDSTPLREDWTWRLQNDFVSTSDDIVSVRTASGLLKDHLLVFGDPKTAAIFVETSPRMRYRKPIMPVIEDLEWCFHSNAFSLKALLAQIESGSNPFGDVIRSLEALSVAARIYRLLPEATLAITALDRPLFKTKWASSVFQGSTGMSESSASGKRKQQAFNEGLLGRHTALSCVAYLESGFCDIAPFPTY